MKTAFWSNYLAVVIYIAAASVLTRGEEDQFLLYSHTRRDGSTAQWRTSERFLLKHSKWDPANQRIPLSVSEAMSKSIKWLRKRGNRDVIVQSVLLTSLAPEGGRLYEVFYYRCRFRIDPFDSIICIVLLDGTILEPQTIAEQKP